MQPLRRCLSLSFQRFWRVPRKRSRVPPSSTLFGMRQPSGGEERSNAYARQPGLKLKQRGKAVKCENILVRYPHI